LANPISNNSQYIDYFVGLAQKKLPITIFCYAKQFQLPNEKKFSEWQNSASSAYLREFANWW